MHLPSRTKYSFTNFLHYKISRRYFFIFSLVSFFYATKEAGYQFGVGCADSSIYLYELFRHIFSKRFIFSVARRGLLSTSNYLLGLANQIPVLDESENHFEGSGEELPNVIL